MKTSTRLADRYIRCEDFAARIDGVELDPEVWAVFAQLSKARNAAELAARLKLDIEAVNAALRRLIRRKLIRKHLIGWRDYAATAPVEAALESETTETSEPTPAPFPATREVTRSAPPFPFTAAASHASTIPTPAPAAPRSPVISFRVGSIDGSPCHAPAVSLRIGSTPTAVTAPSATATPFSPAISTATDASGLRLRPVLDAIGAKAGGGVAGQLLVYRVFLQIPTELMQAAGIHSLSLVDDGYVLTHRELRSALADTARRHAGVDIESLAVAV